MNIQSKTAIAVLTVLWCSCAGQVLAAPDSLFTLPVPVPGITGNSLQYGHFAAYSLAVLNAQDAAAANGGVVPSNFDPKKGPYKKDSPTGSLTKTQATVLGTGQDATVSNNKDIGVMDNAYNTPSSNSGDETVMNFSTVTRQTAGVADPDGFNEFAGDGENSWDARAGAINNFLAPNAADLVFYFDLNETATNPVEIQYAIYRSWVDSDDDWEADQLLSPTDPNAAPLFFAVRAQDAFGWGKVKYLVNPSGTYDSNGTSTASSVANYYLTMWDGLAPDALTDSQTLMTDGIKNTIEGGPDLLVVDEYTVNGMTVSVIDDRWAFIPGLETLNADGTFRHFGPKNALDPENAVEVSTHLGSNLTEFAVLNNLPVNGQTLDDRVLGSGATDVMSVDFRLKRLNNGFDQVYIDADTQVVVPEPSSLVAIAGLVVIGLCGLLWRRRTRAA